MKILPMIGVTFMVPWAAATGVVIEDSFTGANASLNWTAKTGACLTAGDGTGTIPKCVGLPYYVNKNVTLRGGQTGALPDPVGKGALRFTNNSNTETGAIVSNFTFPSSSGLAVTFATVTYGGTGADGIGFFLMDGSKDPGVGAEGGSLGYSCANNNAVYDGLVGAYLGLGMDEFGNFLNQGDNTSSGYGAQSGRIGLRGAGNTAWSWLNGNYPNYYPSALSSLDRAKAVQQTCKTGKIWNYAVPSNPTQVSGGKATIAVSAGNTNWTWLYANYPQYYPISNINSITRRNAAVAQTLSTGTIWDYSASYSSPVQVVVDNGIVLSNYAVIPNAYKKLLDTQPLYTSATTRPAAVPIVYQLKITQSGLLSLSYNYNGGTAQPVLTDQSILASNGALPATFRFGFTGSTGGSNNIHEITCFRAEPSDGSASSAGINTQQSGEVKTGTQVYLAYYHRNNWWGQLTSKNLVYDAVTNNGTVSISRTANWDASCVLTGGSCAETGVSTVVQGFADRTILTYNGNNGAAFVWADLSAAQQTALGDSDLLDYLRGDRSNEIALTGDGLYRKRTSVLGDIVNSSPMWVGPPSAPYTDATWTDKKVGVSASTPEAATSAQAYSAFVTAKKTRLNVTYVGANDGLLHGFRAGSYSSDGVYVNNTTTPNDGKEVLAYMPAAVSQSIHHATTTLDYSNAQYSHAFSVDGTPYAGDLFYNNAWHTWLVGGLGVGGSTVYALDVTDPANFTQANANSIVMKEWTPATISCEGNITCGINMGNTYGVPQIRRFHNGRWGFIFGNGLGSSSGKSGIYIVTIDPVSTTVPPAMKTYYLDTGSGSSTSKNGITYVTPADVDQDHITDYVYAGDIKGNIWRFDLSSATASSWAVSKFGAAVATPLFTTVNTTTINQPITTQVQVAIVPAVSGGSRVMVEFGTGQQIAQTDFSAASYASGEQSLYGIWDWEMSGWTHLAKLPATGTVAPIANSTITTGLQSQTVTGAYAATTSNGVSGYRTVSNTAVCWKGSTDCPGSNEKYGWKLALPTSSEQLIYSPILSLGAFIVNTTIPVDTSPLSCTTGLNSGWTMAINPATGGSFSKSFFGDATNNFVNINGSVVSGIRIGAVGSPSVVTAGGKPFLVNQTSSGVGNVSKISPPGGGVGRRLTWQQIR